MGALARLLLSFVAALTVGIAATSSAHRHTEILPAGIREVDVRSSRGISRRVTDPARVTTIVRWFDALPMAPAAPYYCPMIRYAPPTAFEFRGVRGALLARARTPGAAACGGSLDFSIRRRAQKPLLVGHFLVRVGRLLGIRLVPIYR